MLGTKFGFETTTLAAVQVFRVCLCVEFAEVYPCVLIRADCEGEGATDNISAEVEKEPDTDIDALSTGWHRPDLILSASRKSR